MPSARTSIHNRMPTHGTVNPMRCERKKARTAQEAMAMAIPARRSFDRVKVGIVLGALILGTAGCILGAVKCGDNPINRNDPTGLKPVPDDWKPSNPWEAAYGPSGMNSFEFDDWLLSWRQRQLSAAK